MKKKSIIFGAISTAAALGGVSVFRYFSDMAVARKQPKIPYPVQFFIDRSQDDDIFDPVVEALQEDIREIPYEKLDLVSGDGLLLRGRLYTPEKPKRVIVFMHGWRSSWKKDFSVHVMPLLAMGCALFFADQRSHGESEGEYITYGVREKEDCVLWANRLADLFPELPMYLWGMSMGATTVMLASGERGLPPQLRGIIADCGFTNPQEQLEHLMKRKITIATTPVSTLYRYHFMHRCHFDLDDFRTDEVLKKVKYPILFYHGGDDRFVPTENTFRNYLAAAGEKEMVIIDDAVHCKSFHIDSELCLAKAESFFEKYDQLS